MNDQFVIELPATRGIQSGKPYYMVTLPIKVLIKMLRLDDKGSVLERSQRTVNPTRVKKVAQYLETNFESQSYVIPALTGVFECDDADIEFVPSAISESVGILKVPMTATAKLLDGQHRGSGLSAFVESNPQLDLGGETVSCQFYTGMSLTDRQLAFADINSNAAKPSASINSAYNHRDPLCRFAVELAELETAPFASLVDFEKNTVSAKSAALFPLKTIQDATAIFMGLGKKPTAQEIDSAREQTIEFWKKAANAQGWATVMPSDAKWWREDKLNTHTIVLKATALAGKIAANTFGGIDKVNWDLWQKVDFHRHSDDFKGRCIRESDYSMLVDSQALNLTANKLLLALNCPLSTEMAALETQVMGEFTQPVIPEPPKPKLDRKAKYAEQEKQKGILEAAMQSYELTQEQYEEAEEKLSTVMNEWVEYHETTVNQAKNLMKLKEYMQAVDKSGAISYPRMLLNVRSLRQAFFDCANGKEIETKETETV